MRQLAPISLRLALLVSVVASESVASRVAEFKIAETPCSDQFNVKVIEPTGDIVSGDGNRLTTPFAANFKCGDHIGDCDPQSPQISLSRKGLPLGWARDLMRQDARITSTGTKICFEANSYCQEFRLVEVQIGA